MKELWNPNTFPSRIDFMSGIFISDFKSITAMIACTDSPVSPPIPNFLIYSQDGEFTPYDERSVADPSEASEDHLAGRIMPESSALERPTVQLTSPVNTTTPRSRAASDALEKLLAIQARQISELGQAWRAKYSLTPFMSVESHSSAPLAATSAIATPVSSAVHENRDRASCIKGAESSHSLSNEGSPRILPSNKFSAAMEEDKVKQGSDSGRTLSTSSLQERVEKRPSVVGDRAGVSEWLQSVSIEMAESDSMT